MACHHFNQLLFIAILEMIVNALYLSTLKKKNIDHTLIYF